MTVTTCPISQCNTTDAGGNKQLITTPICTLHRGKTAVAIRSMPRLYTELSMQMAPATKRPADVDRVKATRDQPLGINTENRAMQETMLRTILDVEKLLRIDRDWLPMPRRGREGPTLLEACRFVEKHLDPILNLHIEIGTDRGRRPFPEVAIFLATDARRLLGHANPPTRLPHPCPSCDCRSLQRANGAAEVTCTYAPCSRVISEIDYDRYVLILTHGETA